MALTERLAILIEANAGKAIAEFKKVGGAAQGLSGDVDKTRGKLSGMGGQLGGLAKYAGGAALAGAAAGLVKFAADGVGAFTTLAGEVRQFQQIAGGTSEEASRLLDVFGDLNIDAQAAGSGVFQLTKRIAANGDALAKHGVQVVRDAQGNLNVKDTLLAVGDAYRGMTDPAQRAALLTAAFGKQGTALIPILSRTRDEIETMFAGTTDAEIITDEEKRKAEEYRLAMVELGDTLDSLKMEAGEALVPFIADVAKATTGAINLAGKLVGVVDRVGDAGYNIGAWARGLVGAEKAADDAADAVSDFTGALLGGAIVAITAIEEEAEAFDDLDKALMSAASAERALGAANRAVSDAQGDLNKLLKEGAVDEEKVADARTSLADATRSLADANRGVAKAQKDYDEAVANAAALGGLDSALDLVADAGENLADAQDTQASASERAREAAIDLREAQAGDPEFQTKLADARRKVADATADVSEKSLANVKAQNEEELAVKANADQVERLLGLYNEMVAKNPETLAALSPMMSALFGQTPNNMGGGDIPALAPAAPTGAGSTATTTNNVTINATASETDARLIAKEVMWNIST